MSEEYRTLVEGAPPLEFKPLPDPAAEPAPETFRDDSEGRRDAARELSERRAEAESMIERFYQKDGGPEQQAELELAQEVDRDRYSAWAARNGMPIDMSCGILTSQLREDRCRMKEMESPEVWDQYVYYLMKTPDDLRFPDPERLIWWH